MFKAIGANPALVGHAIRMVKEGVNKKRHSNIYEYTQLVDGKPYTVEYTSVEMPVKGGYIVFLTNETPVYCNEAVFNSRWLVKE